MGGEVVVLDFAQGLYQVRGKQWAVGPRYQLVEHIGAGSYGDVCKAIDNETGDVVALKRIPDVLCCPMLAKRVLREVCIMRRLSNPYIIKLSDVFTRKSSEVEDGIDLFLSTEFADGGDVYRFRKVVSPHDVKMLIWQLLVGIRYLHSCHVWHRDIKSENTLLSSTMAVKICDFGLSRSALGQGPPEPATSNTPRSALNSEPSKPKRKALQRQYTRTVVTPSYRAPEVVMSRGQYTSAIDIWSLGCIFWELLQRQMNPSRPGPPARPLFGVRGEPATPESGEAYVDNCASPLAEQLDVIFNVVGTPTWQDIESVPSEAWRAYLKRLPGRSGNLLYSMSGCDREALDLLCRMLAFDPARRCTADEALAHLYFKGMTKPMDLPPVPLPSEERPVHLPDAEFWKINDPAVALGLLERELEQSIYEPDGGKQKLEWLLEREAEGQRLLQLLRSPRVAPPVPHFYETPPEDPPPIPPTFMGSSPPTTLSLGVPGGGLEQDPGVSLVLPPLAARLRSSKEKGLMPPPKEPLMQQTLLPGRTIVRETIPDLNGVSRPPEADAESAGGERGGASGPRARAGTKRARQVSGGEGVLEGGRYLRRSPRFRDIKEDELPHRKRFCLRA